MRLVRGEKDILLHTNNNTPPGHGKVPLFYINTYCFTEGFTELPDSYSLATPDWLGNLADIAHENTETDGESGAFTTSLCTGYRLNKFKQTRKCADMVADLVTSHHKLELQRHQPHLPD